VTEDPGRFLKAHQERGAIVDEAQRSPELFSNLQGIVDESGLMGRFVLTGSQNFLLLEKIAQSLAGRTAILHLLLFSSTELNSAKAFADNLDKVLHNGSYPPIFDRPVQPEDFSPS